MFKAKLGLSAVLNRSDVSRIRFGIVILTFVGSFGLCSCRGTGASFSTSANHTTGSSSSNVSSGAPTTTRPTPESPPSRSLSTSVTPSPVVSEPAPGMKGKTLLCNDLTGSSPTQVAQLLQACLDSVGSFGILQLEPGVHAVSQALLVRYPIHIVTKGLDESSPPCGDNSAGSCAVIRAVSPVTGISRSFFRIASDHVELDHIVIDGAKSQRSSSPEGSECVGGINGFGMNISAASNFLTLVGMTSTNALCGSGAEISGGAYLQVTNSLFSNNGIHNAQMLWSDGLTIGSASNALIQNNTFVDNTDVDLIFGGCTDCNISGNTISHSPSFASSSYAALMLQAWPGGPGDYSGSTITNNIIDCSTFRCGFGLMIGSLPWYQAAAKGGLIVGNQISGAQIGILINDATDPAVPIQMGPNTVFNCGGGAFLSSTGERFAPAMVMAPSSDANVQFVQGAGASEYTPLSFAGAVLNWWTQDVVPPNLALACNVSHPSPNWGSKGGQCLRSCGALGGTRSFDDACSKHGLVDAGRAYDVPNCCRTICGANQPAPDWGVKNGSCFGSCGAIGGTVATADPCINHGLLDVGTAYDVQYCCKSPCDTNHPAPDWGAKNGQCLGSCGAIGGTAAPATPCFLHGLQDAGAAYDVPYCCKNINRR